MNIFVTDYNPAFSAVWLDDKRQNKMIVETAQMLCTAVRIITDNDPNVCEGLYRKTHANHGCNIWARSSRQNYEWLVLHGLHMVMDYMTRSSKIHKSAAVIRQCLIHMNLFPDDELLPFTNHARSLKHGIDFTHLEDPRLAYRKYLIARWTTTDVHQPKWTGFNRSCPEWAQESIRAKYGNDSVGDSREAIPTEDRQIEGETASKD